jgi:hypothetical protein
MAPGPSFSESSLPVRILAALTTSAIGITAANPADVVKVRFQAGQGGKAAAPANEAQVQGGLSSGRPPGKHHYSSATRAYLDIAREEGFVGGLYKGYMPNLLRNSIISATEIVSYDLTKQVNNHIMTSPFCRGHGQACNSPPGKGTPFLDEGGHLFCFFLNLLVLLSILVMQIQLPYS